MIGTRPQMQKKERNRKMLQIWRDSRLTYKDIGHRFGVTTERARQIILKEQRLEQMEKMKEEDPDGYREWVRRWA